MGAEIDMLVMGRNAAAAAEQEEEDYDQMVDRRKLEEVESYKIDLLLDILGYMHHVQSLHRNVSLSPLRLHQQHHPLLLAVHHHCYRHQIMTPHLVLRHHHWPQDELFVFLPAQALHQNEN